MKHEVSILGPGVQEHVDGERLFSAFAELDRRSQLATFGDDDLTDTPSILATAFREQGYHRKALLLAWSEAGDDVVGGLWVRMPLRDNTSLAGVSVVVDPRREPADVLASLWEPLLDVVRAEGRRTLQVWTDHAADADAEQIVPRTGVGSLPRDALATALEGLGLTVEQVEQHSILQMAPALEAAAVELPAARRVAGTAYRSLGWVGPTPQDRLEPLAALMARMSTDAPSGDLEHEPEVWDADRVAAMDRMCVETGRTRVMTVAEDVATGHLVAYTAADLPQDKPAIGYQEDTLVHGEHRGHRLGMLVKAENLRRIADQAPGVQRLHTWNAGENEHMLAINLALGFGPASVGCGWQLTGL